MTPATVSLPSRQQNQNLPDCSGFHMLDYRLNGIFCPLLYDDCLIMDLTLQLSGLPVRQEYLQDFAEEVEPEMEDGAPEGNSDSIHKHHGP
jgi:hypothetical protein